MMEILTRHVVGSQSSLCVLSRTISGNHRMGDARRPTMPLPHAPEGEDGAFEGALTSPVVNKTIADPPADRVYTGDSTTSRLRVWLRCRGQSMGQREPPSP